MKLSAWAALALALVVPALGAAAFPGRETTRELPLSSFASVSTTDMINVNIVKADEFGVVLHADSSVIGLIKAEVREGVLFISLPAGLFPRTRWYASRSVVQIAMPKLESLEIGGGSQGQIAMGMPEQDLRVRLSAGSTLAGTLACRALDLAASAGAAELAGRGQVLHLVATRRFEGDFSSFEVARAEVELTEASAAVVDATQELSVVASGNSSLRYVGSPRIVRQELSGGASLTQQARQ